jgi:hypothetical protein
MSRGQSEYDAAAPVEGIRYPQGFSGRPHPFGRLTVVVHKSQIVAAYIIDRTTGWIDSWQADSESDG